MATVEEIVARLALQRLVLPAAFLPALAAASVILFLDAAIVAVCALPGQELLAAVKETEALASLAIEVARVMGYEGKPWSLEPLEEIISEYRNMLLLRGAAPTMADRAVETLKVDCLNAYNDGLSKSEMIHAIVDQGLLNITPTQWIDAQHYGRTLLCEPYAIIWNAEKGWVNPLTGEGNYPFTTWEAELAFVQDAARAVIAARPEVPTEEITPEQQAARIIAQAEAQAALMIIQAQVQAAQIIAQAGQQAALIAAAVEQQTSQIISEAQAQAATILAASQGAAAQANAQAMLQAAEIIATGTAWAAGASAEVGAQAQMEAATTIATVQQQLVQVQQQGVVEQSSIAAGVRETAAGLGELATPLQGMDTTMMGLLGLLGTSAIAMPMAGSLVDSMTSQMAAKQHAGRIACMPSTAAQGLTMLLQGALPMALPLMYKLSPEFRGFADGLAAEAWQMFLKPLQDMAPITPEKAHAVGATLFANAMIAGIAAHMMSLTAEMASPLKYVGVNYLAAFLADLASFSRIAGATLGPLITFGLGKPFQYNIQAQLRPMIPEDRDLQLMRAKKELTSDEFKHFMAYHGYTDEWIDVWERYLWMDPRMMEIVRLSEIVRPEPTPPREALEWLRHADLVPEDLSEWWFYFKFAKAGYDPLDIPVLTRAVKWLTKRREQTMYLMQIRRSYRTGRMTKDEAAERMERAQLAPDVIDFRLESMDLEKTYEMQHDRMSADIQAFRKGFIDEFELLAMLIDGGMLEDDAAFKVETEMIRRFGGVMESAPTLTEISEYGPTVEYEEME